MKGSGGWTGAGALVLMVIAMGCGSVKYTRWHKRIKDDKGVVQHPSDLCKGNDQIDVKAFALNPEPVSDKTLWHLSAEGQAAYLNILAGKVNDLNALDLALSQPIGRGVARQVDLTTFKKRIVLSVENKCTLPANRIARLEVTFDIADEQDLHFVSWDKLETRYATVDLGKLSRTSTGAFELAPGVELLGDVIGTQAGKAGWSNATTEEVPLSRRFVEVTGILEKKKGRLVLEGMPGRDLAGNIVVEVTLGVGSAYRTTTYTMAPLFMPAGAAVQPGNVTVTEIPLIVPQSKDEVSLTMGYEGRMRRVLNKRARTIAEGDDVVQYVASEKGAIKVELVAPDDLRAVVWVIQWGEHTLDLRSKNDPSKVAMLAFRSRSEAGTFLAWLQNGTAVDVGAYDLVHGLDEQPIPTDGQVRKAMEVAPVLR